ncbi:MAG: hypothetical protein V4687_16165 [Bacteroidota bacterium]
MRVGDIVEAYGTNGNPNRWSKITVSGQTIITAESHPEWFRTDPIMSIRNMTAWEWVLVAIGVWNIIGLVS